MGKLSNFFNLFKKNSLSQKNNSDENENIKLNLKDSDCNLNKIDNNENIYILKEHKDSNYDLNNTSSNESDFLKLFKYDSISDSSKTFNIETALNNNWDKIDTFSTNISQQIEQKADLIDGKVPNNQLPEIGADADAITIADTAANFTSDNVEGALAELFQYANSGKTAIRNAIDSKGVTVSLEDTFTLLASKITTQMCKFGGTAVSTDVLSGKTFINNNGEILTGSMANQGAKNASLTAGGSYIIPEGYHNGNGIISANSLAGQTTGTASASNILSPYTAWVGGVKITGTMTNQGAVSQSLINQGGQYIIPSGYHNGSGKVTANINNLVSGNIKKGINVGGIVGTLEQRRVFTKRGTIYEVCTQDRPYIITVTGVPFRPKIVNFLFYLSTNMGSYAYMCNYNEYTNHEGLNRATKYPDSDRFVIRGTDYITINDDGFTITDNEGIGGTIYGQSTIYVVSCVE